MGLIDLRTFAVATRFDRRGQLAVAGVWPGDEQELDVQLADVARVNALAVQSRKTLRYRVMQHELRLILSYLSDRPGRALAIHSAEDFRASASHIKRLVTESFGLGMLTAAVQSHYGWHPDDRSLSHFDVLPTRLGALYAKTGVRPDLLFDFSDGGSRWRLAGEARGRFRLRPSGTDISADQRKRLDQIVAWSGRNDLHPITMTWAYSGSSQVQVDLFKVEPPRDLRTAEVPEPDEVATSAEEPLFALEQRAAQRAEELTAQLYDSAPEPDDLRSIDGRRVRGNWVAADLIAPSDTQFLLGVLDQPLPQEGLRRIRRPREATPRERDQDPVQIAVMERILVVVARETSTPPSWPEIVSRINRPDDA